MRDKRKPSGQSIFKTMRHGMGTLIDTLIGRVNLVRSNAVESAGALSETGWQILAQDEWQAFEHVALGVRRHESRGAADRAH